MFFAGIELVYGGGTVGLMGTVARAVSRADFPGLGYLLEAGRKDNFPEQRFVPLCACLWIASGPLQVFEGLGSTGVHGVIPEALQPKEVRHRQAAWGCQQQLVGFLCMHTKCDMQHTYQSCRKSLPIKPRGTEQLQQCIRRTSVPFTVPCSFFWSADLG